MLEQLQELLTMQKALDSAILRDKGITQYPKENMKIALFVELGEMLNEFPTKFKHWKSSAVDNREKGLVEYVDCLHFALSLYNNSFYAERQLKMKEYGAYVEKRGITLVDLLNYIWVEVYNEDFKYVLAGLFHIGNHLGFTWDEIYETYMKKNAINYERLKNNY